MDEIRKPLQGWALGTQSVLPFGQYAEHTATGGSEMFLLATQPFVI